MIASGEADVLIDGFKVRQLGPSDDFGERALLRDTPRTATVRAVTAMQLLAIDRDQFLQALTGDAGVSFEPQDLLRVPVTEVLRQLPVFAAASDSEVRALAGAAQRQQLPADAVVFDVGDASTEAYVILRGRVELPRNGAVNAVLLAGDIFGELSVIHGTTRPGRAVVTEPVDALVLPADAILRVARASDAEQELTP